MGWPFASKRALTLDFSRKSAFPSTRFALKLFRQLAAEHATPKFFSRRVCLLAPTGRTGMTREPNQSSKLLDLSRKRCN